MRHSRVLVFGALVLAAGAQAQQATASRGGPKVRGEAGLDPSLGVHGSAGSQYYFQAGSRLGVAFNAGIVDILVQAPTIAWTSGPFAAHEILSVALSIGLN